MGNVVPLIISILLFFLGLAAMAWADTFIGFQGLVFTAGILLICLSFALPAHVLQKLD